MILVTGGTGFVGRHAIAALVARHRPVRRLTRSPSRTPAFSPGVEMIAADLLRPAELVGVLRDVDTILHLAAVVPGSPSAGPSNENVETTRNLLRAARTSGVQTFIYMSSAGVYGDGASARPHRETDPVAPRSAYEISKFEAERLVTQELAGTGIRWTVLRPTGIHGPSRPATLTLYRAILRNKMWLHGPTRVIVHPTYIDDVVQAILLVLDRQDLAGEVFNVGGSRFLSYTSLIALVAAQLNPALRQIALPAWPLNTLASGIERGLRAMNIGPPGVIARWSRPVANRAVDITRARALLGFQPVDLEISIRETIDQLRRQRML